MKKLIKPIVCLAILLVVIALTTGCVGKATGGGWFIDENTGNKCTFGFNANLKDNPGAVNNEKYFTGQFQFKDHGTGQKIHLKEMILVEVYDTTAYFEGTDKDGNLVEVDVVDQGEPGADAGDYIEISYNGQTWAGVLQGGNIQTQPAD